jgi:putative transposase
MDAIHYKVRQDNAIVNKAAYMVIGIDLEGHKDVLGMWIGEHRGVKDILINCVDNLSGFSEAIAAVYPQTDVQKCIVHQLRNSFKHVSYKELKAVSAALKPIYKAVNEQAAAAALDAFEADWGRSIPTLSAHGEPTGRSLLPFFSTPKNYVRSSIQPTSLKAITVNFGR